MGNFEEEGSRRQDCSGADLRRKDYLVGASGEDEKWVALSTFLWRQLSETDDSHLMFLLAFPPVLKAWIEDHSKIKVGVQIGGKSISTRFLDAQD